MFAELAVQTFLREFDEGPVVEVAGSGHAVTVPQIRDNSSIYYPVDHPEIGGTAENRTPNAVKSAENRSDLRVRCS
ncbi:hypothetical protein RDE2_46560 [Rhodococcus sp. RDE2]|nr:hypothetical protein RDE2_46560 [Rhodococcus sp. RDE2]